MIVFVAKHSGGFCWWQKNTTEYGVRNIPWREGKGDLLADLLKLYDKFGLDLGVYIYPGDRNWGAGLGMGVEPKIPPGRKLTMKFSRPKSAPSRAVQWEPST